MVTTGTPIVTCTLYPSQPQPEPNNPRLPYTFPADLTELLDGLTTLAATHPDLTSLWVAPRVAAGRLTSPGGGRVYGGALPYNAALTPFLDDTCFVLEAGKERLSPVPCNATADGFVCKGARGYAYDAAQVSLCSAAGLGN